MIDMYLYDDKRRESSSVCWFCYEHSRYDLMLVHTNRHYGKTLYLICKQINSVLSVLMI